MSKHKLKVVSSTPPQKHEVRADQSIELLQELHILTREGKLNQDSRRKLKQIYHLYQFIEPLLHETVATNGQLSLVDHGAGKSYLGFILYDLFIKHLMVEAHIYGIETREELVHKSKALASKLNFTHMSFLNLSVAESINTQLLPPTIDLVTALHACNTATDDAIRFAIEKQAKYIVLIPCCQAEVAAHLRNQPPSTLRDPWLNELWRHPIHAREFGSHITNVFRCLLLESKGYQVTTTELVGWEHSLKNELIIARNKYKLNPLAQHKLTNLLTALGLTELTFRFNW